MLGGTPKPGARRRASVISSYQGSSGSASPVPESEMNDQEQPSPRGEEKADEVSLSEESEDYMEPPQKAYDPQTKKFNMVFGKLRQKLRSTEPKGDITKAGIRFMNVTEDDIRRKTTYHIKPDQLPEFDNFLLEQENKREDRHLKYLHNFRYPGRSEINEELSWQAQKSGLPEGKLKDKKETPTSESPSRLQVPDYGAGREVAKPWRGRRWKGYDPILSDMISKPLEADLRTDWGSDVSERLDNRCVGDHPTEELADRVSHLKKPRNVIEERRIDGLIKVTTETYDDDEVRETPRDGGADDVPPRRGHQAHRFLRRRASELEIKVARQKVDKAATFIYNLHLSSHPFMDYTWSRCPSFSDDEQLEDVMHLAKEGAYWGNPDCAVDSSDLDNLRKIRAQSRAMIRQHSKTLRRKFAAAGRGPPTRGQGDGETPTTKRNTVWVLLRRSKRVSPIR
eukprot:GHVU01203557.1.p1 GENE.GHVU01203557.1~~GHVU01203557.1.p1  ORF type:complete len:453 (+),score=71.50 GHVU01203557.1:2523-3881(+)